MVQWHTRYILLQKVTSLKNSYRCKTAIYKLFQTISDTFISIKTPKTAKKSLIFASKTCKKASFLLILPQKVCKTTAF